jgi:hypothetical protein
MNSPNTGPLFSQVSTEYRHYAKLIRPGPALKTSAVYFKWHLIYPESLPILAEQVAEAQAFLRQELASDRLKLSDEVGFVVQHRTPEWLILYVCSWRGNNEVWETLYQNRIASGLGYQVLGRENTSPTFCVWVLSAVAHEHRAWTQYLKSARDAAAREVYLHNYLSDEVW